ncbi:single-stranded-DNA-specific exonuclease RecJ [Hirschia litorea]|uniref:Single-stranded-DNA-specific exonuclease RecJ n=1 Tax=Hirschia litorea TaxID=1199156 RepID=A0ABW2IHZ0_9PROT
MSRSAFLDSSHELPVDETGPAFLGVEQSLTGRKWRSRPVEEGHANALAQKLGKSNIIGRLLAGRGIGIEEAGSYFTPTLKELFPDPSSFTDMDAAIEVILDALVNGRRVAVLADYDVDGGTSAAILTKYFRAWGHDLLLYVPDRLTEGYGPSPEAFKSLQEQGAELVITVDCGAAAVEALETAHEIGVQVVVLDHHLMQSAPPPAAAVVNPNRPDCESGCGHLCAAGVVFILTAGLNRLARQRGVAPDNGLPDPMKWLDLCALGTLCDMAPLKGVNRAFVNAGLKVLARMDNIGLEALSQVSGVEAPKSVYHATFLLGPRLNAGGRIGDPWIAAKLLGCEDRKEALVLAERLHALNEARKEIEADILDEATRMVEVRLSEKPNAGAIVVGGEGWHPGVIGIVAGRLKEKYHRPTIVIGWGEDLGPVAKGSGRSVAGVNLGDLIAQASREGVILSGGGHAMAAGLSLEPSQLDGFREFMEAHTLDAKKELAEARVLDFDGLLSPASASGDLLESIEAAGPYGAGAPEPLFALANVRPNNVRRVGVDHLSFEILGEDGGKLRAIAFRVADTDLGQVILSCKPMHLAGKLKPDEWRGAGKVQFEVLDGFFQNN